MSKHNYSQYSKKNNDPKNQNNHKPKVEITDVKIPEITAEIMAKGHPDPVGEPGTIGFVQETVETVALPNIVDGVVARCSKLNVREKPILTSEIVCVLNVTSEIKIDVAKSTDDWFYVCCATGAEGYCMREYIDAHM